METNKKVVLIATIGMIATMLMTSVALAAAPDLKLPYPGGESWYISQAYNGTTHQGLDYYALDFTLNGCDAYDRPVLAVASGTVIEVDTGHVHGEPNSYGNKVVIKHEDGYTSLYGHLNQTLVQKNQKVAQGKNIGTVGNTGYCLGSVCKKYPGTHLHFRMLNKSGKAYKPEPMSCYTNFLTGQWRLSDNYGDSWNFNTSNNAEGWEAINVKESSVNGGRYFINPKQNDPYIQSATLSLDSDNYDAIEINMSSNCPDGNATIYFMTEDLPNYSEDKNVSFKVNTGDDWYTYTIYMVNHNLWNGTITGIRIDPAENGRASGVDTVGFDWIKVINTDKKPTIVSCDLDYVLYQGSDTLTFGYWIKNPFANDLEGVRLGAQIRTTNPLTEWIDDSGNDKTVVLNSGTYEGQRRYERFFKLPIFASAGDYDAHWVILNHKTGEWYDNEEKMNAFVIEGLSPTEPNLDLIILFDTTGSMGPYIADAQASAAEIVEALDSTEFDYRVAIADYRDFPEDPYGGEVDYVYNLDQSFSSDKDVIIDAIDSLSLGWGADWQESVYSALVMSMLDVNKSIANSDNYGWREGAFKAIILLGDAPPHNPEPWEGGHTLDNVTYWSENIDPIRVYSVVVGYDSNTYIAFSEISEKTGGKAYLSPEASDVSDAIIEAIEDMKDDGYGVSIEITPIQNETSSGSSVIYSVNITNKGDLADVYNVSFEAENIVGYRGYPLDVQCSWIMFNDSKMELDPSMSEIRSFSISVPENWAGMEDTSYTFGVNAKSKTNADVSNTSSVELKIKADKRSMIEYSKLEIQWLAEIVKGSTIDHGIKNALLVKLANAESKADQALVNLDNGKIKLADNMLQVSQNEMGAFTNLVEAQYDKKVSQPDAEMLKEKASQILEDLETAKNS